jgi:hypothetical protein
LVVDVNQSSFNLIRMKPYELLKMLLAHFNLGKFHVCLHTNAQTQAAVRTIGSAGQGIDGIVPRK